MASISESTASVLLPRLKRYSTISAFQLNTSFQKYKLYYKLKGDILYDYQSCDQRFWAHWPLGRPRDS
jgi:hypothetical protein